MLNKQLYLIIAEPGMQYLQKSIAASSIIIGRSANATIRLHHDCICQEHLQIRFDEQGRLLGQDLSRGRTALNYPLDRLPRRGLVFQLPSRGVLILAPDAGVEATFILYVVR